MAETDWKIEKPAGTCTGCQAAFSTDSHYFSALFKLESGLSRKDFCAPCFQNNRPADVYYFWKTQVPVEDPDARKDWKKRPAVDIDYVFDFFKRLENETAPQQVAFRYILALMLSRKKLLTADGRTTLPDGESAQVFAEKRGGAKHTVREPSLSEEEIGTVSAELGVLLGIAPPPQKTQTAATTADGSAATETGTEAAPGAPLASDEAPDVAPEGSTGEGETVESSATAGGGGKGASE